MLGLAEKFGKPGEASALRSFFQKAGNAGINAVAAEMAPVPCMIPPTGGGGQGQGGVRKSARQLALPDAVFL